MLKEYGSTLDGAVLSDYFYLIKIEKIILNYYSGRTRLFSSVKIKLTHANGSDPRNSRQLSKH